jgi:hypothetical protein
MTALPPFPVLASSKGQDANPASAFLHDDQRSGGQFALMLSQRRRDQDRETVRQNIFAANLEHAWSGCTSQGQGRAEVQVMA